MKVRLTASIALLVAILFSLISMPNLLAQGKKAQEKKAQEKANIQGTVQNMSKDLSTIIVRTTGTATRLVVYNPKTQFLYGHSDNNKPGNVSQVKDSYYISCVGTFDAKNQLMATECVYRETR